MSSRRPRVDWRGIVLLIIILLVVALYDAATTTPDAVVTETTNTATPMDVSAQPEPPVATDALQLFTTTGELVYPDVSTNRTPPALYAAFLADVNAAQTTIDIAVFDIDLPELGKALLAAHTRGVTVRVAFDDENLTDARVSKLIGSLQDAHIPVVGDGREPFMHEKTAVIDGRIVWTGSWNMTINDTYRNNNNMLRIVSPQMAQGYVVEADQLMSGLFGVHKQSNAPHPLITLGKRTISYAFSPVDGINAQVVALIDAAKTQLTFMAFSYTDPAIGKAMVRAQKRGVQVRGVMEKQNTSGTGSVFAMLKKAKVDIIADGNCYIMHHKTIVIDTDTVITGSYNFTKSAEKANDENLLVIRDGTLVQQYLAEYDRVRERADNPQACNS